MNKDFIWCQEMIDYHTNRAAMCEREGWLAEAERARMLRWEIFDAQIAWAAEDRQLVKL